MYFLREPAVTDAELVGIKSTEASVGRGVSEVHKQKVGGGG